MHEQQQDHYEILGVEREATGEEIRNAWRRLTLKHHPDRANPETRAEGERMTRAINAAYECLSDAERRSCIR